MKTRSSKKRPEPQPSSSLTETPSKTTPELKKIKKTHGSISTFPEKEDEQRNLPNFNVSFIFGYQNWTEIDNSVAVGIEFVIKELERENQPIEKELKDEFDNDENEYEEEDKVEKEKESSRMEILMKKQDRENEYDEEENVVKAKESSHMEILIKKQDRENEYDEEENLVKAKESRRMEILGQNQHRENEYDEEENLVKAKESSRVEILIKKQERENEYEEEDKVEKEKESSRMEILIRKQDRENEYENLMNEAASEKEKRKKMKYSPELKLEILKLFIEKDSEKSKDQVSTSNYDTEILREVIKQINKTINFETARTWIKNYRKDKEYLLILEADAKEAKNGRALVSHRQRRLKYRPELEMEIFDWILFQRQNEVPISAKDCIEFAREIIQKEYKKFKGSYSWFGRFCIRNNVSLRVPNNKASQKLPKGWTSLAGQFRNQISEIIEKESISSEYVVNMDEMPLFYEYLPRKIVDIKGTKDIRTWKAGLDKKRCTLILAVSKTGTLLKPGLILPRKTRYSLTVRNDLDMKLYGTEKANAWIDSSVMILWLKEVFIPYIGKNKGLLILDTYGAHYSSEVQEFLKKCPNIFIGLIPGGLTPILQPLDYTINAALKNRIKQSSLKHQVQGATLNSQKDPPKMRKEAAPETQIVIAKRTVGAEKDLQRLSKGSKKRVIQTTNIVTDHMKVSTEDLYKWIKEAFDEMVGEEGRITVENAWRGCGYV